MAMFRWLLWKKKPGAPERSPTSQVGMLLQNHTRSSIIKLLRERPGMNRNQLAKELGITPSAVGFHVERLVEAHIVETKPAPKGREMVCFTNENVHLWNDKATRVLYGRGLPRRVACYLVKHPGADVHQIAWALDEPEYTVRRHLMTLRGSELIARTQIKKNVYYHPQPRLEDWVESVGRNYGNSCDWDCGKC